MQCTPIETQTSVSRKSAPFTGSSSNSVSRLCRRSTSTSRSRIRSTKASCSCRARLTQITSSKEEVVAVRRREPLVREVRPVHHHRAECSDLGIGTRRRRGDGGVHQQLLSV